MPLRSAKNRRPEDLHFATPHPDGRALRYHFDEFIVELIDRLLGRLEIDGPLEATAPMLPTEEVRMYVEQSLYLELLESARTLFRYRYLANLGHTYAGRIVCPRGLQNVLAPELLSLPGVHLVAQSLWSDSFKRLWHKREFLSPWKLRKDKPIKGDKPLIAVELVEGADLDSKSDAFWMSSGLVDPAQILFVLEPHNSSFVAIESQFKLIEAMGANLVALSSTVSGRGLIPIWMPQSFPTWATEIKKSVQSQRSDANHWLIRTLLNCIERVAYWESFYREHRVAISQNFTELTSETIAKRLAISRVGGIEIGKMRSEFFDQSSPAFHFKHEIAFVWHSNIFPILRHSKTNIRHVLESGYVYDYLFKRRREAAATLRKELESRGATRIIAVFDNSTHLNSHTSKRHFEEFYCCLAQLVSENPHVGIILKPKKQIARAPYLLIQGWAKRLGLGWLVRRYPLEIPDLEVPLAVMRQSGRCIQLTGIKANVIDAGLAADIVVGIPCSTAACEASLADKPMVMYDPSGAHGNPICDKISGVSYLKISEFFDKLNVHLKAFPKSAAQNEAPLLIDSIRDGAAADRIGAFISTFLRAFGEGYGKNDGLDRAFKEFSKRGGRVLSGF